MSVHTDYIDDNEDIYRGDPPIREPVEPAPSIASSSASSSSSSSSSSSFLAGGRLGAIAAKLELAISRWARNVRGNSSNASDSSSSSSSSSSSRSSVMTLTKSQLERGRRRRFRSISSLRTMQSEREIAARITRMKALEKSRQIPREFALYLPPSMMPVAHLTSDAQISADGLDPRNRRITWTKSLPLVLAQLDLAIRKPARHRRLRQRHKDVANEDAYAESSDATAHFLTRRHHGGSSAPRSKSASAAAGIRNVKKGKDRAIPESNSIPKSIPIPEEPQTKPEAWFLDVANPTWADLKAIGNLLHIHPLTLEDILQQDPREKLELFSNLGYYFISFRAIESQETREKIRREAGLMDASWNKPALDDGSIGEANVYLAVFKDGICCFHFTDISEHTNRVRDRLVLLEQIANKSSDWITHNILDSIVDSFFPFLEEIEKEIMAIDHIVYTRPSGLPLAAGEIDRTNARELIPLLKQQDSPIPQTPDVTQPNEKYSPTEKSRNSFQPQFASPHLIIRLLYRCAKRRIVGSWNSFWANSESTISPIQLTLRRMARTRKLVTVLGRLLAAKSEVITQIRKRHTGRASERQSSEELELSIYMGDVQDHILTLQHSLTYYERMLSQSHPAYLSQLRSMSESAKADADIKILYLSCVTISVLCITTLTGLFSMNVHVPHNLHAPGHPFNWFYVILVLSALIVCTFLYFVRYWYRTAKRRGPSL